MMTDPELAKWSMSKEEWEMLEKYFMYDNQDYDNEHAQQKNREQDAPPSHNPPSQDKRNSFISSGKTRDISIQSTTLR
jgi:hypothetical protein